MTITETPIDGLLIFSPIVIKDNRGYFFENFRSSWLEERGIKARFVQDNESKSDKNVSKEFRLNSYTGEEKTNYYDLKISNPKKI